MWVWARGCVGGSSHFMPQSRSWPSLMPCPLLRLVLCCVMLCVVLCCLVSCHTLTDPATHRPPTHTPTPTHTHTQPPPHRAMRCDGLTRTPSRRKRSAATPWARTRCCSRCRTPWAKLCAPCWPVKTQSPPWCCAPAMATPTTPKAWRVPSHSSATPPSAQTCPRHPTRGCRRCATTRCCRSDWACRRTCPTAATCSPAP